MLPLRRLAMVQAPRLLVRAPVAAPSLVRSLHSAPLRFSPIPTDSDNMHNMSSTTTAGKGLNEAGGKNDNAPNAHNTNRSTSNSGTAGGSKPESSSDHKYGPGAGAQQQPTPAGSDADPITEVKEKVKRTAKKAKSAVQAMGEDASDNVHYGADKAKVGFENVKAEVKNTVRKAKTSVKQTTRDLDNNTASYSTGAASQSGVDTEALKAKAKDAAATAKQTASSVLSSVKQAASSAVNSLKDATAGATAVASEKLSDLQDRAATTQDNVSTRMSNFGSRMEEKLEKFGEGLAKSGEEIDRRNREPGEPLPEPLPLDKVDHLPNPKNLDDVLPGTGFKDQQRNTPITDRKGGGAFPG